MSPFKGSNLNYDRHENDCRPHFCLSANRARSWLLNANIFSIRCGNSLSRPVIVLQEPSYLRQFRKCEVELAFHSFWQPLTRFYQVPSVK